MKRSLLCAALAAVLAASGAAAQTVYKSTMPDGKVVYGEKPVPGASRVEKMEPPPPKTGVSSLTPEEKARAEQIAKDRAAAAALAAQREAQAQKSVEVARQQLKQAEAARDAGKEPLPGERIGIVGGGTRLTEGYFARQKKLEEGVAAARKHLEEVQRGAR